MVFDILSMSGNYEDSLNLLSGPPKALDEDETEFLDKLEEVRLTEK